MPVKVKLFYGITQKRYFLSINDKCLEINRDEFEHLKVVFDLYEDFRKFIEEESKKEGK